MRSTTITTATPMVLPPPEEPTAATTPTATSPPCIVANRMLYPSISHPILRNTRMRSLCPRVLLIPIHLPPPNSSTDRVCTGRDTHKGTSMFLTTAATTTTRTSRERERADRVGTSAIPPLLRAAPSMRHHHHQRRPAGTSPYRPKPFERSCWTIRRRPSLLRPRRGK